MSEEHHLSRKQLREQGKLVARDAAAPSLTTTAELRLRRPSRRELREAARINEQAEEKIRQSAVTHEGKQAPERISLYDRHENADESDVHNGGAEAEFAGNTTSGIRSDFSPHSDHVNPDESSYTASSGYVAQTSDDHDIDNDDFDGIITGVPEGGSASERSGAGFDDFFGGLDSTADKPEEAEVVSDSEAAAGGASAPSHDSVNRTSLFERFTEPESEANAEHLAESPVEAVTEQTPEQHKAAEEKTQPSAESDEENVTAEAKKLEKEHKHTGAALEDSKAESAEAGAKESTSAKASTSRTSASQAEAAPEEGAASLDTKTGSPVFGWLVLLILIIIGALIGYLLGTWITVTFLSAPLAGVDQLAGTVLMV